MNSLFIKLVSSAGDLSLISEQEIVDFVAQAVREDVYSRFIDFLNDKVNSEAKKAKKLAVSKAAFRYNPDQKAVFTIVATHLAGRTEFVDLDLRESVELAMSIYKSYKEIYEDRIFVRREDKGKNDIRRFVKHCDELFADYFQNNWPEGDITEEFLRGVDTVLKEDRRQSQRTE